MQEAALGANLFPMDVDSIVSWIPVDNMTLLYPYTIPLATPSAIQKVGRIK